MVFVKGQNIINDAMLRNYLRLAQKQVVHHQFETNDESVKMTAYNKKYCKKLGMLHKNQHF